MMGARGPQRTNKSVLEARGSKLAAGRPDEVEYSKDAPDCPCVLGPEAKIEWDKQIRELASAGVLQTVDRAMLACWCEAWGEFVSTVYALEEMRSKEPTTWYVLAIASGLLNAKNKAVERLGKLAPHFGFSPAARTRVAAHEKKASGVADDKSEFFS